MSTQADTFIDWMRTKRSASPNTLAAYDRIVTLWSGFLPTPLNERTPEDVETFTARPRRYDRPPAAATIVQEVSILNSFYRWTWAKYGWDTNPATLAGKPKVHNRQPRPVEDDAWVRLWQSDLPQDARVALGLGYFCGLRRAEIVALTGSQIWGRSIVNFTRKGGGEDRMDYGDLFDHFGVFLPHVLPDVSVLEGSLRALAKARGEQRLMPWPSSRPKAMNKRMPTWLEAAGLGASDVTPHRLRHSFATNLLRTGVPLDLACDLCNHSSPAITMRYVRTSGGRLTALRTSSLTMVGNP